MVISMNCPIYGKGSWVIKYGGYKSRDVYRHRYKCKHCDKTFVIDYGYKWLNYAPCKVRTALAVYANGLTLRETAELLGCIASTVWKWIVRYAKILYRYTRKKQPRKAFQLHLDELFLRMKKRFYYLFDSIGAANRFAVFTLEAERTAASQALTRTVT
jgi:transposase-like protein